MLALGAVWYVAFLFSITLHEAAHAFAAYRLGDPTAYLGGQVTLNPLPHIRREFFGTVVMPILSFFLSGWMMGWASAPYDPFWAGRNPKRAGWMALAGPAANLLLVIVSGVALRWGLASGFFAASGSMSMSQIVQGAAGGTSTGAATLLSILFTLNLLLFAFNLLPLPPLDGSSALAIVLSERAALAYLSFMRQPIISILGLLFAWYVFGSIFRPILYLALRLLFGGFS
jgi:Zn-dependent protease